jgi:2-dehydropantoate 2-reductase
MEGPGHVRHNGRGDVVLGEWFTDRPDRAERRRVLDRIAEACSLGFPASVTEDIRQVLWTKLAMNCGYNALSALGRARYSRLTSDESSTRLMRSIVDELVTAGQADGVALDREAVWSKVFALADGMPEAISSTGQDIAAGRATEIEDLNGYVVRRGAALGVATPFNEMAVRLVRILESAPYDEAFFPKSGVAPRTHAISRARDEP